MQTSRGTARSQASTQVVRSTYRRPTAAVVTDILWIVSGAITVLLLFRFALKALEANPGAGFVRFVYDLSDVFMTPFAAIFASDDVAGAVFEWSALVAAAVYLLVAWGLVSLVDALARRTTVSQIQETDAIHDQEQVAATASPPAPPEQGSAGTVATPRSPAVYPDPPSVGRPCQGAECPA